MNNPMDRKKQRIDDLAESSAGGGVAVAEQHVDDAGAVSSGEGVSLIRSAFKRLRRNPVFLIGAFVTAIFLLTALFAPWLAPNDPAVGYLKDQVSASTNPIPAAQPGYPLGGDDQGRDILSRLIWGARQTLYIGLFATLGGFFGGLVLGTLAGALGGWVDSVVMRIVDILLSLPSLLLATLVSTVFGRPNMWTLILAISIVQVPIFARLLRGSMLAQRHSDHVLAARALGVKRGAIIRRHMLPNSLGPVLVQSTLVLATSIIDAAGLTFIGLGNATDDSPEWGQMLGSSQSYIDSFPALAVLPALCIIVVALGFTLMGESMREALDPKSRR